MGRHGAVHHHLLLPRLLLPPPRLHLPAPHLLLPPLPLPCGRGESSGGSLHRLPPPPPPATPSTPSPSLSSTSFSSSYPCSSASSDAGFEEGEMSEDGGSLAGDNEDKLNLSEDEDRQDAPQDKDRLEDEEFAILDEQLERLVLSIIDD